MAVGSTQAAPPGKSGSGAPAVPPAAPAVQARLLGAFALTAGEHAAGPWPRPSARRLCALLLVSPGRRMSRDLACEELFPRLAPRAASRSLSKALSMARVALAGLGEPGAALIGADLTHVWLSPEITADADAQADALRAGLVLTPGEARDNALSRALADDGELLADEPYADWAERARDRLDALRQEARLTLARDRSQGAGRAGPGDATAIWRACLDHDPACEEAAGALIREYLAQDRPEQAARVFGRCRTALERLGLRISPSLEQVYASVAVDRAPVSLSAEAATAGSGPVVPALADARTGTASGPATAGLPREERRPVTVLFAEVAATVAAPGTLGLEDLRDLVSTSLASVISEVEALGGTVSSVSGRGLQAMFGAPEAHEDDPERALRAAYRALASLAAPGDVTLDALAPPRAGGGAHSGSGLRIGVESGPALVGPIGGGARVEYAALGDVVSAAAALQSAARPGSVLAGPATRAAAAHLFSWGPLEAVAVGTGAEPLAAAYLDAPRATAAPRRPRLGGQAALGGRHAELRVLDNALRAAVAGSGQAVVLAGEPGIGKTRLVQEARKRFIAWVGAGGGRRPLWLEGRSASYASATPYGLYRQLIASWTGVALDQPAARQRQALAEGLTRLTGNSNLLLPLSRLMGLPLSALPGRGDAGRERDGHQRISPEEQQRQSFAAVRALVTRFAAVAPTVLVLEDLHWADPTSLRLTAELAQLAQGRQLLLLATTRQDDDYLSPRTATAAPQPVRTVRLRALPEPAARSLAASLLGQVGRPDVLAAVLADTDGNPLFLEERLAAMLEAGILVREQGGWRLRQQAGPASPASVPQVLERLVRARVDRLSPAAAETIRAAAVLGTEFTVKTLAAMLGATPADLAPVLAELSASDLMHHGQREAAQPSFRFRHALIQEATYLALLRNERRELHARAARALTVTDECQPDETAMVTVLGRHYAVAEDAERAVHYLELGGDQATAAFANDEAIAVFREALTVTARVLDASGGARRADRHRADVRVPASQGNADLDVASARLQAKLANVLWRTAHRAEAGAAFRAALSVADGSSHSLDPALRAHLYTRLGRLELTEMRLAEGAAAFKAAEALLDLNAERAADVDQTDDVTVDQWLELMVDGWAGLHAMCFEADRTLALLEQVSPVLETRGTMARKTSFYRLRTSQRMLRKRLRVDEDDIAELRASVAAAARSSEDKDIGYATVFLGWALLLRGDLAAAAAELTRALSLADRMGEIHLRDLSLMWLSLTALRRHDVEELRALLPRAFAAADTDGHSGSRAAHRLACAAWLAWQDGHPDEVRRLAAEIERVSLSIPWPAAIHRWVDRFPLLAVHLAAGEIEQAVAVARQLLDPAQPWLPDDLTAAIASASAAWDAADEAKTTECLNQVLDVARTRSYC